MRVANLLGEVLHLHAAFVATNSIAQDRHVGLPENPSARKREAIEVAARAVLDAGTQFPDSISTANHPLALLMANRRLDRAVDPAYCRRTFEGDADRVAFLFEEYAALTDATADARA